MSYQKHSLMSHQYHDQDDFTHALSLPSKSKSNGLRNPIGVTTLILLLGCTFILVNSQESFQIQVPDQQAHIGKLYYYKFPITSLSEIKEISVKEAGDDQGSLPEWLTFNKEKGELIGVPFNKGLHFIQVKITKYDATHWSDIFALDVIDVPVMSMSNNLSPTLQNQYHSNINNQHQQQCTIRIKETFTKVQDVWNIITYLSPPYITSSYNTPEFQQWILKFTISRTHNDEFLVTLDDHKCSTNIVVNNNNNDDDNELINKLRKMGLHAEVLHIMKNPIIMDNDLYNDMIVSSRIHSHSQTPSHLARNKYHNRRHLDDKIHGTPVMAPDWMTLSTSTLLPSTDINMVHSEHESALSRSLIPSMTSPTVSLSPSSTHSFDISDHVPIPGQGHHHSPHPKYHTPNIYTTPVISPERPTNIEGMATPIFIQPTSTMSHHLVEPTGSILIEPSPSLMPDVTPTDITDSEVPTVTSVEVEVTDKSPPIASNKPPYINKRLRKLELSAGKYWKFSIPADTFVDFEDGNTRKLKLTFLQSSSSSVTEEPSTDYWIQFDHENQYLYALPTEDVVGKHLFSLIAVDSQGVPVTETLEIHVRQNKLIRAFTHQFTLTHVTWQEYEFAFLIEAITSLMQRITTRIYNDVSLEHILMQKIVRSEDKKNVWTISWTNDSIPTHPCPREMIQDLYSKLHDPERLLEDSSAEPSRLLKQTISPEFEVQRVQLNYMHKSACGSEILPDVDQDKKPKVNPEVRNRIGRLGPFKLGEAFHYKVPEDTFFSSARDVSTRELTLSLSAIDPPRIPDFITFDPYEQEFYGLALRADQIRSYELNLVAEDKIIGEARASDIFTIEIVDEPRENARQYTFEVVVNLLAPAGREDLSVKERVDIVGHISGIMGDSDSSAVRILSIKKFLYDGLSPNKIHPNYLEQDNPRENEIDDENKQRLRRSHRHKHVHSRHVRDAANHYYFEFKWTNKSILGLDTCPQQKIVSNIIHRIFKRELDSMRSLKEVFEPNYELLNVEFIPIGSCEHAMRAFEMGHRPVAVTSSPPTFVSTSYPPTKGQDGNKLDNGVDMEDSNEYLLTTIIPPIAILVALIFAAIVGCCFHRANRRRKSVEISTRIPGDNSVAEREAFLQKGRVPVIFDFEQQNQQQNLVQQQQQQQYNMFTPVIMPPQQQQQIPQQQMTPMRQLGKSTYQQLPQPGSQQMRRQPPPYK